MTIHKNNKYNYDTAETEQYGAEAEHAAEKAQIIERDGADAWAAPYSA